MDSLSKSSKQYYSQSKIAEEYDKDRFISAAGKMFDAFEKDFVVSTLKRHSGIAQILDAGAGTGRFSIEFAKMGFLTAACDYSPAMLKILRAKIEALGLQERVSVSRQDICRLAYANDQFDFVCCMRVLVNLDTRNGLRDAIAELLRVCRSGGVVVFDISNPLSVAAAAGTKDSMLTSRDSRDLIESFPAASIAGHSGRRIIPQSVFEMAPTFSLRSIDKLDSFLSSVLPSLCVRQYFTINKK